MASSKPFQPMLQQPFIEENDDRKRRPMIWKARKLDTFWAPTFTIFSEAKPEANMHWGLQIGNYMYQIHTDEGKVKYLIVQRLHGEQIWTPDVPQKVLGYCNLTDTQVKKAVVDVQERMQCSPLFKGAYDPVYNNCQSFVMMLVAEILCYKHTVLAEGFADIVDLTRWRYEHRRTSALRPYYKEALYILKVWPKILVENNKFFKSHPSEYFKISINPVSLVSFILGNWARAFREGKLMRTREILLKEGVQVLLPSSLKEGEEDHHVDRDDEDVKHDEHDEHDEHDKDDKDDKDEEDDEDDEGTNKEGEDLRAWMEQILKDIYDRHQTGYEEDCSDELISLSIAHAVPSLIIEKTTCASRN